jgi:hypothetical protein
MDTVEPIAEEMNPVGALAATSLPLPTTCWVTPPRGGNA